MATYLGHLASRFGADSDDRIRRDYHRDSGARFISAN
jgi:hypothetical protein